MEGFIVRIGLALIANAIALLIADLLLDGFSIKTLTFVWLVIVFTAISLAVNFVVDALLRRHAPSAVALISLVTTSVALAITDIVSDDLRITGIGSWVLATVIIWLATVLLGFVGPWRRMRERRARGARTAR